MSEIVTAVVTEEKNAKVVVDPSLSRKLLKLGYTIIDIKPRKNYNRESCFVFKVEGNFMEDYNKLISERNEKHSQVKH